ncbi:hypothetical protein GJ496_007169 [Pomphorhynchus laevis]|nr:hypothetical protein GJ496_007169 [Pomphorhynchus laevis]
MPASAFQNHEHRKRAKYEEHTTIIEHSNFQPLIFACTGGASPAASHVIKRIGTLKAERGRRTYSEDIRKMRTKIAFELARAASACIRAPRSTRGSPIRCERLQ